MKIIFKSSVNSYGKKLTVTRESSNPIETLSVMSDLHFLIKTTNVALIPDKTPL